MDREYGKALALDGCCISIQDLDAADNIAIECGELFCGNPVFECRGATDLLHMKLGQVAGSNRETKHISDEAGCCVLSIPFARDEGSVFLVQHRVENWLLVEARGKSTGTALGDQVEFFLAYGPIEDRGRICLHG